MYQLSGYLAVRENSRRICEITGSALTDKLKVIMKTEEEPDEIPSYPCVKDVIESLVLPESAADR